MSTESNESGKYSVENSIQPQGSREIEAFRQNKGLQSLGEKAKKIWKF